MRMCGAVLAPLTKDVLGLVHDPLLDHHHPAPCGNRS
jgi:hypothetical protein